jgi:hypothetical protein
MPSPVNYVDEVGAIVSDLRRLGLEPILVGGMALVVLGSQRVTQDFDFVVAHPADRLESTLAAFYDRGFELVSRVNDRGKVTATIDNRKIASIRLRLDAPSSAYFYSRKTELRIDLLFDFPIPAATLADNATRIKVQSHVFHIASEPDLLRLKKIAQAARSSPGDAQDIAFLEARRALSE